MESGSTLTSHHIAADQLEKEKMFWLNRLSGPLLKSFFPYDTGKGESRGSGGGGAVVTFAWTGALFNGLSAQSNHSPYKIHIILLAGITLLLDKYTGNRDIIVITPVYKPDRQENYVNLVLPVRATPAGQHTFKELLKQVSTFIAAASAHQNYPMEILLEQLGMPLIQGEPSLLDTAVVMENIHDPEHIRSVHPGVSFFFRVTAGSLQGKVEYPAHRYERTGIERIILHLERLLGQAVQSLDLPLSQLEIVSPEEKKQLLNEINPQGPLRLLTLPGTAHLPGQGVYIVDGYDQLQPPGVEGEVCTAAAGLAGGLETPFLPGRRLVKTGDLGRWLPDGGFEFSGREANRFIHKGCKIQPEKLERLLLKLAPLDDVVVAGLKDEQGWDCLRAYFVPAGDLSPLQLKERLSGKLPGHLMPGSFVRLERIPLTPEGKTDRDPHLLEELAMAAKTRETGPVDPTQEKLTTIWSEVLERETETLHPDLDFSRLGGQSLKAIMMSARIHKAFNISIPIPTIFQLATLRRMAQYVREAIKTEFCPLQAAEKRDYYELSPGQERLYLLQQLDPESISYNVPQMVILEGTLQRERLEHAFTGVIQRHESFRTSFRVVEDRPVQQVHDPVEFAIAYHEPHHGANKQGREASREFEANFIRPFDLTQTPLLRVGLVKENNSRHILMVDRHHIISDATSRGIFLKDILRLYEGKELPSLRLQYKDYSQWQNSHKQKPELKEQENYWLEQFSAGGEIPVLNLTLDYPRPGVQCFAGKNFGFSLGEEETQRLHRLAAQEGATLFMLLLAIYTVFLSKLSNQEDIIVGTPVLGRRHEDLKDIIGIFVNTLALRNFPVSDKSFKEFLKDVKTRALSAFENQVYPFEKLVDHVVVNRDISRNPLFDTVFMLQEIAAAGMGTGELRVLPYEYRSTTAKFDLLLSGCEENHKLDFFFEYGSKLFKESTIQRYAGFFKKIIAAVLENNHRKISGLEILTAEEKKRLLLDFNRTYTGYPREKTLHRLFEEQAENRPDHIALAGVRQLPVPGEGTGGHAVYITYHELNRGSHRLARVLLERGVKPDSIVGIMVERSVEMITGILGILKAGGAYLPIPPDYPEERICYLVKDSGTNLLVTAGALVKNPENLGTVRQLPLELIILEKVPSTLTSTSTSTLTSTCQVGPANLAYTIYTSGTTGKPKGTLTTHRNVIRVVRDTNYIELKENDRILQLSNYAFDGSVFDIYGALLNGSTLVLIKKEDVSDVNRLCRLIEKEKITVFFLTTALFNTVVELNAGALARVRKVLFGGEQVSVSHARQALGHQGKSRIIHVYGPTETTVYATYYNIDTIGDASETIPIGKPISNTLVYILARDLNIVPIGVTGELCIGGDGTARGYLNQPELTFEKFIHDKKLLRGVQGGGFLEKSPPGRRRQKIYKTGDLARWLEDGNIEFLGRIDHQVKIRGFRIEPGEIENQLLKLEKIAEAVVVVRGSGAGKYLCAYVVAREGKELGITELKQALARHLPGYMIPSYLVRIEKIPLTANGKIHRDILPDPEIPAGKNDVPPRDDLEKKLAETWSRVLGVEKERIGIDRDFFDLGGHSLKATSLIARVHRELNVKIPLVELFQVPTIRAMAEYIKKSAADRFKSIETAEEKEYYELSAAQKRLYLLQRMQPDLTGYNIPLAVVLEGELNRQKPAETFRKLIKRHESLRTLFKLVNEIPVQGILKAVEFEIEFYEALEEKNYKSQITNKKETGTHPSSFTIHRFIRPFDLSQAPLLRVGLIKQEEKKHILIIDIHHIITDGTSMGILVKEFMRLYANEELPRIRLRYKDFSQWQYRLFAAGKIKSQQEYWRQQFQEEIPVLDLPTDYPRPAVQSYAGGTIPFELSSEQSRALHLLVLSEGVTWFIFLTALFAIFLAKISSLEDIVMGTPVAGRRHADLEQIVGIFVNTLVLRNHPHGEKNLREFLKEVKENALQAFENQEYQFEELVEQVDVQRDISRNPLFDVMFSFHQDTGPEETQEIEVPGLTFKSYPYEERRSKFDLILVAQESDNRLSLAFSYCSQLFKEETVRRFAGYFKQILDRAVKNPGARIAEIEIIPAEEKKKLLYHFNDTAARYPAGKTLHELFARQVKRTPDHTALLGEIPNPKSQIPNQEGYLTYRELNKKSAQLAETLREKGVRADTIAGIMAQRSIHLVIGVLGILMAGGAYLPIDPNYPAERVDYILKDSNAKILLTAREITSFSSSRPHLSPWINAPATSLAYVIYTSGSTGGPKGVMVNHAPVVNTLFALNRAYPLTGAEVLLLKTSYLFDVSVTELFGWFLGGGQLALLEPGGEKDPRKILDTIEKMRVTRINFVPSMFYVFVDHLHLDRRCISAGSGLKYIFLAGEALLPGLVNKFRELNTGILLENLYGPTEAAVYASGYSLSSWSEGGRIPVGKPLQNTKLYILDKRMRLSLPGTCGELYISGDGIAGGYLNNPELTAEKFCLRRPGDLFEKRFPGPSQNFLLPEGHLYLRAKSQEPRAIFYKTGDRARWLPDGNIEFLGRIDHQVKIRGFRIELGEIENRLSLHPKVKTAVVLVKTDAGGDPYLCAYIVPAGTKEKIHWTAVELEEYLTHWLPDYMIPGYFIEIEQLPLTPNGKIHRGALPEPKTGPAGTVEAPRDEIEKKMVEIWGEVLGRDTGQAKIGITDHFFKLGGHSLKAAILAARIQKEFKVEIPLLELFKRPYIKSLAEFIRQAAVRPGTGTVTAADDRLVLLKKKNNAVGTLFFIHDGSGEVEAYLALCGQLSAAFDCRGIRALKIENYTPRNLSVQEVAQACLLTVKTLQARGPYYIAGWSIGGTIAFEMVRQIEQRKEKTGFLGLIDTLPPDHGLLEQSGAFNAETELNLIRDYFPGQPIKERLEKAAQIGMHRIWPELLAYLAENESHFDIDFIKDSLPGNADKIIPNFSQLGITESIYSLNMIRTLRQARSRYIPGGKIKTVLHFFRAADAAVSIDAEKWNRYCRAPVRIVETPGNHFSMVNMPEVKALAALFDKSLPMEV